MKLAYFVHDLTDPAVGRRVRMLKAGGAAPVVVGFRRDERAPQSLEGCPAVDLGRTYDARLGHRARMAVLAALRSPRLRGRLAGVEVVVARTLEMLFVAEAARWTCGVRAPLVYECLDVHRLMLDPGVRGLALRTAERMLMRRASLMIVSSPAFLEAYFAPVQGLGRRVRLATMLVENKVLELGGRGGPWPAPPPGPPWRIGWLGAIRCRRSFAILSDLAARRPDLVEVRIHGRPAYTELEDFDRRVAAVPNLAFGGPYATGDLPRLYGEVHFSWAVDYMEEGLNSAWLLPNRIYESGRFGAVPIALAGVETGRWLAGRGFGVRLGDAAEIEGVLERLTPARYAELRRELEAVPRAAFTADEADCRRLVEGLRDLRRGPGCDGQAGESSPAELAAWAPKKVLRRAEQNPGGKV